jgi:glycerophosphoryl diester phosphodiesterase
VVIIGHRGARGEAPENTAGGFAYALEKGVRHFELDLRLSADNIPMVIHDTSTRRTCGESILVAHSPADLLGSLDAASGEQWQAREPIPTLADILPLLESSDSVQLEIKSDQPARLSKLIKATRQLLRDCDRHRYTLTSFDQRALRLAKSLAPEMPRGLVTESRFADNIGRAQRLACSVLVYHFRILSQRQISRAQDRGLQVSSYTVNDLAQVKKLKGWGVDSVITDHPVRYLHLAEKTHARHH